MKLGARSGAHPTNQPAQVGKLAVPTDEVAPTAAFGRTASVLPYVEATRCLSAR